jgi:hypothetical protein
MFRRPIGSAFQIRSSLTPRSDGTATMARKNEISAYLSKREHVSVRG